MITSALTSIGYWLWAGLAGIGTFLWMLIRPGLRVISVVLFVAAIIALTMDVTRWQTDTVGPWFHSLAEQIRASAPATLDGIGRAVSGATHPWIWDPILTSVLALPAWVILLVLGLLVSYGTRERRHINIFIN